MKHGSVVGFKVAELHSIAVLRNAAVCCGMRWNAVECSEMLYDYVNIACAQIDENDANPANAENVANVVNVVNSSNAGDFRFAAFRRF